MQPPPRRRRSRLPELILLTLAMLVLYLAAGFWLRYEMNYSIGDAIARTANAKYMLFARDAHAAALGFVWMPIPTVAQLPLMLILEPLGRPIDAGPISTAMWGAGTVWVIGRMSYDLGLPRATGLAFAAVYGLNPVVMFYAANGMSEGVLFFFLAMAMWGFLRYLRDYRSSSVVLCAVGLAGMALTKYEAIPLVVAIAVLLGLADYSRRRGKVRALMTAAMTALPPLWLVGLWFAYMKVIKGSVWSWRTEQKENPVFAVENAPPPPPPPEGYDPTPWLETLDYSGNWVIAFFPTLLLLLPVLLLPPWRRMMGGLGILSVTLFLPGVTWYLLAHRASPGNPRYFTAPVVMGAVALVYAASRVKMSGMSRVVIDPFLVGLLAIAGLTGGLAQMDRASTNQENEWRVFQVLRGEVDRGNPDFRGERTYRQLAAWLDARLQPGELVLADVRTSYQAELFSRKPKQFIINNDRDYQAIVAEPNRPDIRIDYAIVASRFDDAGSIVRAEAGQWELIADFKFADVYRFTGERSAPGGG